MAVNNENFEKAMVAAMLGPEIRKVKIDKHQFNIKPYVETRQHGISIYKGQISHHLRFRDDDQIYYEFKKEGLQVSDVEINIDEGFKFNEIFSAVKMLLEIFGDIDSDETQVVARTKAQKTKAMADAYEETKKLLDGSWQGEAKFLIANIALRAS